MTDRRATVRCATGPSCRGFTLVEAVATIVIIGTIGTLAGTIFNSAISSYRDTAATSQLDNEMSAALDRITRKLRSIANDAGSTTTPDINAITASSITWETDNSLSLSGGNLTLIESGGAAQILVTGITAFSVQAYDEGNSALGATLSGTSCDAVRRIGLTLTGSRGSASHTLRTKLYIRSTMTGAG